MSKIYLLVGEKQQGPYSSEEIRKMVSSGEVSGDILCWEEGMAEWQAWEKRVAQRPAPVTIAPPRRTKSDGASNVDFRNSLKKKGELSARKKPFTLGTAVIALILFFAVLTLLIEITGRTLPDVRQQFNEAAGLIDIKDK